MLIYNVGFLCLCSYLSKNSLAPHKKQKGAEKGFAYLQSLIPRSAIEIWWTKNVLVFCQHMSSYISQEEHIWWEKAATKCTQGAAEVCLYQTKKFIEFKRWEIPTGKIWNLKKNLWKCVYVTILLFRKKLDSLLCCRAATGSRRCYFYIV